MSQRHRRAAIALVAICASLTCASFLTAGCADAPDHLQPAAILESFDHSYVYEVAVRSGLLDGQSARPYFRVVVHPAFSSQWSLSIEPPVAGQAKVDVVEARPIYTDKSDRSPGTLRFTAHIDAVAAEGLREVLEKALLDTRPCATGEGLWGNDGVVYEFSAFIQNRGVISGETWSPEEGTRRGRMVKAVRLLYRMARAGRDSTPALREELLRTVKQVRAEFLGQRD